MNSFGVHVCLGSPLRDRHGLGKRGLSLRTVGGGESGHRGRGQNPEESERVRRVGSDVVRKKDKGPVFQFILLTLFRPARGSRPNDPQGFKMNAIRLFLLTLAVAALFAPVQDARATGLGLYFEYGNVFGGQLDQTIGGDLDFDEDQFGGGFSVDTNVAADRLFNYRLDVGYHRVEGEYGTFGDLDGNGLVLHNSFGFGVFRNHRVRVWLGPAVRLNFDSFDDVPIYGDVFKFGVGVGPEVGINLHTEDSLSIGLTTGYQIRYVLAVPDGSSSNEDGYEHMAFIKLHVLFRLGGDSFVDDQQAFRPIPEQVSPEPARAEAVEALGEGEESSSSTSWATTVPSAPVRPVVDTESGRAPANQSADDAYNMRVWKEQQRHAK